MKTEKYIEVAFAHLTEPNLTSKKTLFRDVERFYRCLSEFCGVHLRAVRGFELGNTHEHGIVLCRECEVAQFYKRFEKFQKSKAWTHKTIQLDVFDHARREKAYEYTLVKHEPVSPIESREYFCPKKYHRCRKGKCTHIPAT